MAALHLLRGSALGRTGSDTPNAVSIRGAILACRYKARHSQTLNTRLQIVGQLPAFRFRDRNNPPEKISKSPEMFRCALLPAFRAWGVSIGSTSSSRIWHADRSG